MKEELMEELEFSQRMVKVLDGKTLQDTLKKAGTQGFTVPGFTKNACQAPPAILAAAMKKNNVERISKVEFF
jgi:hypothetical protein